MTHSCAIGPLLGYCAHLSKERLDARITHYDITPSQTHVLLFLHNGGGQALQGQIVSHLQVKPSTANGILCRMEEKGLIVRTICNEDARQRQVTLTPRGTELQEELDSHFQEVESIITHGMSAEEQANLLAFLKQMVGNLEEDRTLC